jgi:hypothetical protein
MTNQARVEQPIDLHPPPSEPMFYTDDNATSLRPDDGVVDIEVAAPASTDSSDPVYTTDIGAAILTVLRVCTGAITSYQVYAVAADTWELIGLELLYVDALCAVAGFKKFLTEGGTIADWKTQHPDGIKPRMLFRIEKGQSK